MVVRLFNNPRRTTPELEAFFESVLAKQQARLFPNMGPREIMTRLSATAGSIPPGPAIGHTDKTGRFIPA